jgi:hypothetical protein
MDEAGNMHGNDNITLNGRPVWKPRDRRERDIKIGLSKQGVKVWTRFIHARVGSSGRFL